MQYSSGIGADLQDHYIPVELPFAQQGLSLPPPLLQIPSNHLTVAVACQGSLCPKWTGIVAVAAAGDMNTTQSPSPVDDASPKICEVNGGGLLLPLFGNNEQNWPLALRDVLYLLGLLWSFVAVAIIADLFMGAIERITAKEVCPAGD